MRKSNIGVAIFSLVISILFLFNNLLFLIDSLKFSIVVLRDEYLYAQYETISNDYGWELDMYFFINLFFFTTAYVMILLSLIKLKIDNGINPLSKKLIFTSGILISSTVLIQFVLTGLAIDWKLNLFLIMTITFALLGVIGSVVGIIGAFLLINKNIKSEESHDFIALSNIVLSIYLLVTSIFYLMFQLILIFTFSMHNIIMFFVSEEDTILFIFYLTLSVVTIILSLIQFKDNARINPTTKKLIFISSIIAFVWSLAAITTPSDYIEYTVLTFFAIPISGVLGAIGAIKLLQSSTKRITEHHVNIVITSAISIFILSTIVLVIMFLQSIAYI